MSRLFGDGQHAAVVAANHRHSFGPLPALRGFTAVADALGEGDAVQLAP